MKRIIVLMVMLCVSIPALAETPVSQNVANTYYQTCMSRDDTRLSDETQDAMCSCTSARLMVAMNIEDIGAMKAEPGPGRTAYNKMMMDVYGPCLEYPIKEQLYNECMSDRKIKNFALRDQNALCRCTSEKTALPLSTEGTEMMRTMLQRRPNLVDPMDSVLNDQGFREQAYNNLYSCLGVGN